MSADAATEFLDGHGVVVKILRARDQSLVVGAGEEEAAGLVVPELRDHRLRHRPRLFEPARVERRFVKRQAIRQSRKRSLRDSRSTCPRRLCTS